MMEDMDELYALARSRNEYAITRWFWVYWILCGSGAIHNLYSTFVYNYISVHMANNHDFEKTFKNKLSVDDLSFLIKVIDKFINDFIED